MIQAAKKLFRRVLPRQAMRLSEIRAMRYHRRGIVSYGQEGEDRVLASLLFKLHSGKLPSSGFYIDIGAHDPFLYSNTYAFYKLGWFGLNIDAAPGSMSSFNVHRPRDINVEIGIGVVRSIATFHVFNKPALSTFDAQIARDRAIGDRKVIKEVQVEIAPAADIFARYLAPGQIIDFMTVDVEGLDAQVLKSNDWQQYRPMVVAVEIYGKSVAGALTDEVASLMTAANYVFYSKTVNTAFFADATVIAKLEVEPTQ